MVQNKLPIVAALACFACSCLFAGADGSNGDDNNVVINNANNENNSNGATNSNSDPELCGNGRLDPGEKCDPCGTCGGTACKPAVSTGSAEDCTLECAPGPEVTTCVDGDGCCPETCDEQLDSDCDPLCGNGDPDPGELCDPCPESCPDSQCEPLDWMGDPSTCDFECVSLPPPAACCGDKLCDADEQCIDMQCQPSGPCANVQCPDTEICVDGECVERQTGVPCMEDGDCLPWQYCGAGGFCERWMSCGDAIGAGRAEAWCAAGDFTDGPRLVCVTEQGNADCHAAMPPPTCDPTAPDTGCYAWEACLPDPNVNDGFVCGVPANCLAAEDVDVFCQFALSDLAAECRDTGSTFECVLPQ